MQKIIYTQNYQGHQKGDIATVSNNVAHGLFGLGVAELYSRGLYKLLRKEIRKPPADTMMRPERSKRKVEKGRYRTK